ncbi:MAG: glycoside hydrolase family 15 protein [Armatimonadetes bacterium]|nr:glycoside hydrolase family 15 protein [Armatimonadota bacterium]
MPRSLVFGNQRMLVNLDHRGVIRDLYWPGVGLYNHLQNHPLRMGFWVDGEFSWTDDDAWQVSMQLGQCGDVARTEYIHPGLGIEFALIEWMDPERPVFYRRFEGLKGRAELRIFWWLDLRLCESDIGDTALFVPELNSMVHYKRDVYLAVGSSALDQYSTGVRGESGESRLFEDAFDGELSMRAVDQGSVDSLVRFTWNQEDSSVDVWIAAGDSIEALRSLMPPQSCVCPTDVASPPPTLVESSLRIIKTQTNENGAILAANDGDILKTNRSTYSYMWPRDGALVSMAMDLSGEIDFTRRYFEFCRPLTSESQPYYLHKYGPDGTFGATWHPWIVDGMPVLPIQEDETSLMVQAFVHHWQCTGDREYAASNFDHFVALPCRFLMAYRDETTGLPKPSWDLWEERRGTHAFTVASVVGALSDAAELAAALGRPEAGAYLESADRFREAMLEHMVDPDSGRIFRCLNPTADSTVDSATLQIALLGALPADHPAFQSTLTAVRDKCVVQSPIGGVARYERDYYFRRSDHHPGNPWIICTMWLAQVEIMLGNLDEAQRWLDWAKDRASSTGMLSEQYHPETGEPLSVAPLTWSHAEVVRTSKLLERKRRG